MPKRPKKISLAPVPSLARAEAERLRAEEEAREQEQRRARVEVVRGRAEQELAQRRSRRAAATMRERAERTEIAAAGKRSAKQLADFERSGYRQPDGPTVDRLLRAGDAGKIEIFSEVVELSKGDKFEPTPVEMVRFRIEDSAIKRLTDRKLLARDDVNLNACLGRAAEEYFNVWMRAGIERLGSVDFAREGVPSFGPGALFASEAQLHAWQVFNTARAKVPEDFRPCVDAIVLQDRNPVEVGREIGAYHGEKQATAVAIFVLRRGLTALAHHFGLLSHSDATAVKGGAQ